MKQWFSLKILRDVFVMIVGTAIIGFAVIFLNIPNHLAEGGITGITLIFRALFGINPAISTLLLNIPLILIGRKYLGLRSFYYTLIGTFGLSFWLAFWQKIPFQIDLQEDILIAALLAGLISGVGSGLVYKVGGTTGGSDIFALIIEKYFGISVGRSLLIFDSLVLSASLTYISLNRMMYTLIFAYVFSKIIDSILDGGYAAKGILVMSEKNEILAEILMHELERGVTYLNGEGGYSKHSKKMLYMVMTPREITLAKRLIHEQDPQAFISIINVHEVHGEGFSYLLPKRKPLFSIKK
ncbi:YitT family protein [Enterococcus sp. LJL98]